MSACSLGLPEPWYSTLMLRSLPACSAPFLTTSQNESPGPPCVITAKVRLALPAALVVLLLVSLVLPHPVSTDAVAARTATLTLIRRRTFIISSCRAIAIGRECSAGSGRH